VREAGLASGSWVEPMFTYVKKEKTGASGRSMIRMVSPFGSFLMEIRFSKDARSCATVTEVKNRVRTTEE